MNNRTKHITKFFLLYLPLFLFLQCDCRQKGEHTFHKVDTASQSTHEIGTLVWEYNPADGWLNSSPFEQGIDSTELLKAHKYILRRSGYHSFLVIKNGYLVFEKYYSGFSKERLNNLKSATKSVTSILIGITLEKDLIEDINQPLEKVFPECLTKETDSSKRQITLKHLLTMTAGLKWNNFGGSVRNSWWGHKNNPHKYAINSAKLIHTPGEVFNYNSALSHLLGAIVVRKSGMPLIKFANMNLFEPLGIDDIKWDADNTGLHRGHSELWMKSRDMAKVGYLYLREGYWYDKQIVSKEWVRESIEPYIDGTGVWAKYGNYGYQWWSRIIKGVPVYFAAGYGGQFIFIIPKHDVVVVTTTQWYRRGNSFTPIDVIRNYIIPSMK